ncbi:MAG: bacillithiol biosynthesis cysteine-adding enzyme BshC, partial [Ignavibacteria bacterium RBG_13_36_8]
MYIKFEDIPGHQNLFLEYLYNYENVSRFFEKNFRNLEMYPEFFARISSNIHLNRKGISEIIKSQYEGFKISKQTRHNIELLSSEKTLAVVTGQQLGIFGGPLYTFYKIITAIKLCKYLKENFDEYHFIPIFWLEGDDHDLDEVRSINIINNNNEQTNIGYDDGLPPEANRGSVGNLLFNDNLDTVFAKLSEVLRDTEYKNEVIDLLSSHYKKGASFRGAFRNLLFDLFDDQGLIIFDPLDVDVKKMLKPIFRKEIEDFRNHAAAVVERSAELDESYHTQVKIKPINLFLLEDNERLLLEPVEDEFRPKGKRKKIPKEEILSILETEPERFSPNVLLRPICQDYLLPT